MKWPSLVDLARLAICFFCAFVISRVAFPWRTHFGSFGVSWHQALAPYVATAALMTFVVYASIRFVRIGRRLVTRMLVSTLVTFTGLAIAAGAIGPFGIDPGFEVRATLFTEYKFLTFIFEVALPFAALSAFIMQIRNPRLHKNELVAKNFSDNAK